MSTKVISRRPVDMPVFERVEWSELGIRLPHNLTYDEWENVGRTIQTLDRSIHWALGDWINFGEHKYGEMYAQAIEATAFTEGHLRNVAYVARRYPHNKRRATLTFNHHYAAAPVEDEEGRNMWLDKAEENLWTVKELRQQIKGKTMLKDVETDSVPTEILATMRRICGIVRDYDIRVYRREDGSVAEALEMELSELIQAYNEQSSS